MVQNMNHIYLSYPETESINVCPVGHPSISTLCLWEREMRNFSRKEGEYIYDYNKNSVHCS